MGERVSHCLQHNDPRLVMARFSEASTGIIYIHIYVYIYICIHIYV